jgi:hypothetical protein
MFLLYVLNFYNKKICMEREQKAEGFSYAKTTEDLATRLMSEDQ